MVAKPGLGAVVDPGHALATNLVAAYLFNEGSGTTAADSSGNGGSIALNLTAISWGTSTLFGPSPALICAATAGTTRGVATGIPTLQTNFSIELWLTYQTGDAYAALLVDPGEGLFIHNGKLDFYRVGDHDGTATLSASTSYQVFCTYDNTNIRFYLDGVLDATVAVAIGSSYTPDALINNLASETFVGTYDVLRVWQGRTLDATEIGTLYGDPFAMYVNPLAWLSPRVLRGEALAPALLDSAREMARARGWLTAFDAVVAADLAWLRPRHMQAVQDAPGALEEARRLSAGALAALGLTAQPWWLDSVNIGKGFERG